MYQLYDGIVNSPETELTQNIGASATTIPVKDASKLPAPPNLAVIGRNEDAETILYTGKSGNTLTGVTRGFQGQAKSWKAGAPVARRFTEYDWRAIKENSMKYTAYPVVNVKGFGAKGDGVTDDTAAIQAALDAVPESGGAVFIPEGNYLISATLLVRPKTVLFGVGKASQLTLAPSVNDAMIRTAKKGAVYPYYDNPSQDIVIHDIALNGNKAQQSTHTIEQAQGIHVISCSNFLVKNIWITDTSWNGIACDNALYGVIENCFVEGSRKHGIYVATGCVAVFVRNCTTKNCGGHPHGAYSGIAVAQNAKYCLVEGCYSTGNERHGITVDRGENGMPVNCSIIGNFCVGNSHHGIMVYDTTVTTTNLQITDNVCVANGRCGIQITYAGGNVVKGNIISANAWYGLFLYCTSHNRIECNECADNGSSTVGGRGILIGDDNATASMYNVIIGNQCLDRRSTRYQEYGILSTSLSDRNIVIGNVCRLNTLNQIQLVGENNIYDHNITSSS